MKIFSLPQIGKRGESVIEVIIAAVVLTMTATAAAVLLSSAFASNALTRDRMRAVNLAKEGLEAVRNIRDTNILRSGAFKDYCWNFQESESAEPDANVCNDKVTSDRLIKAGKKNLKLTADYKWYLSDQGNVADPFSTDFFVSPLRTDLPDDDPVDFYRVLEISYFTLDPDSGLPNKKSSPEQATIMEVKSSVFWRFKGQENSVTLRNFLSRYH